MCVYILFTGLFSLEAVVERLRELLPPTFEDLDKDFACAVLTPTGEYVVLDSGPLPEAVAASAAIPFLFAPVHIPGLGLCQDGGARERIGLPGWRQRVQKLRKEEEESSDSEPVFALVHLIQRSFGPFSGNDSMNYDIQQSNYTVVTSPKSGVSLLSLGDYDAQYEAAQMRTMNLIENLKQTASLEELQKKQKLSKKERKSS